MLVRIDSQQQVLKYTVLITALAVAAPVGVVGSLVTVSTDMTAHDKYNYLFIALMIPLLIAPPIAYFSLALIRTVNESLSLIDAHVKYDPLTGVFNRTYFLDSIRSRHTSGTLLLIDADHFKQVNDTRGHAAGDEALCILSRALQNALAHRGFVGRLGGEEFGIFMPGVPLLVGVEIAEQVCASVRTLNMIVGGMPLRMTISIGGAEYRPSVQIGHALRRADTRMYQAKALGRDRAVMVDIIETDQALRQA